MKRIKLLPNIHNKIKKVLKNLGLTTCSSIPKTAHKYSTMCTDNKERKFFFKIRMEDNPKTERAFINEINYTRFLNQIFQKGHRIQVPKILKYNIASIPEWSLFRLASGKYLDRKNLSVKDRDLIVNTLLNIQKIPLSKLPQEKPKGETLGFWQTDYLWYINRITNSLRRLREEIDYKKILQAVNFVVENQKLLDNYPKVLAHGDWDLSHIFLGKNSVILFDWEHARIDIPTMDLAFLFVRTRGNKKWSRDLVLKFIQKKGNRRELRQLFRISIIRYSLKRMANTKLLYEDRIISKEEVEAIRSDCLGLFYKALKGFSEILK